MVADNLSLPSCIAWARRVVPGCPFISKWETKASEWASTPIRDSLALSQCGDPMKDDYFNKSLLHVLQIQNGNISDSGELPSPIFLQSERRWASFWAVHLLVKRWVGPQPKVCCSSDLLLARAGKAEGTAPRTPRLVGAALQPKLWPVGVTCWKMLWACSQSPGVVSGKGQLSYH